MTGQVFKPKARVLLHSATITVYEADLELLAFHASMAMDHAEVKARLAVTYSEVLAERAIIRVGFDRNHPLLSAEVVRLLGAAENAGLPLDQRIDIVFERRIVR